MNLPQLRSAFLLVVAGLALAINNCSTLGDSNGSGVGNGMICGKLFEPDGKTPANGAVITLWDRKAQTNIDSSDQVPQSTPVLQTFTDKEGFYSINRIGSGMYAIEASDSCNNMVRIDSIAIQSKETRIDSLVDTLKKSGAIKGKIVYDSNTYILRISCFGTHSISCYPSSKDSFIIAPLAEGHYELEIGYVQGLTPFGGGGIVHHQSVWVSRGDTAKVTIDLTDNLPSVGKIDLAYNLYMHSATINWSETTKPVLGYNLYRRVSGATSFGPPLNGSLLIHDTMFVDSTAFSGSVYQYAVAAVDSANRIGPLSEIVSTSTSNIVINLATLTRLIEWKVDINYSPTFVYSRDPNCFYLMNYNGQAETSGYVINYSMNIQKFNTVDGNMVSSWDISISVGGTRWIAIQGNNSFYQKTFDTLTAVVCRDSTGNERILDTTRMGGFGDGDVRGNTIALVSFSGIQDSSVNSYRITRSSTADGLVVYSIKGGPLLREDFKAVRICADGTICLFLTTHILQYDASGHEKASIELPQSSSQIIDYSDSMYMKCFNFSNESITFEFAAYNFSNEQLFDYKVKGLYSYQSYMAPNGDIFLITSDSLYEKGSVYRLPNPLHKN